MTPRAPRLTRPARPRRGEQSLRPEREHDRHQEVDQHRRERGPRTLRRRRREHHREGRLEERAPRKTDIAGKMGALKSLRGDQVSVETKRKLVARLAEDASKVGDLQVKYVSRSISNPAFKAKLDKLVSDYQTLLTQ